MFVVPLVTSIRKWFLVDCDVQIILFSDQYHENVNKCIMIPSYGFPEATLYRYRIFTDYRSEIDGDWVFYLDVDSMVVGSVGEEILGLGLTACCHPGFYRNNGWGSPGCSEKSLAWLPKEKWTRYYCGGFQGGQRSHYLLACKMLADRIDTDETTGARAVHNDETHWNAWLNSGDYNSPLIKLDPSYMMVEELNLRKAWGIANLEPKIIALKKNHAEIRA